MLCTNAQLDFALRDVAQRADYKTTYSVGTLALLAISLYSLISGFAAVSGSHMQFEKCLLLGCICFSDSEYQSQRLMNVNFLNLDPALTIVLQFRSVMCAFPPTDSCEFRAFIMHI